MRHVLQPSVKSVLVWLIQLDPNPKTVPVFPEDPETRLVVAHLLNGKCYAEVVLNAKHLITVCGRGFPLGRLFFHVKNVDIADCCVTLPATTKKGELS
jgi:hypothetical protein